jgi:hypothetical protein
MLYGGCQLARVFQVSGWPGIMPWLLSYTGSTSIAGSNAERRAATALEDGRKPSARARHRDVPCNPVASTIFYPRAVSRKHRRSLFIKLKPKEVNHDQDENDQRKVAGTDLDR